MKTITIRRYATGKLQKGKNNSNVQGYYIQKAITQKYDMALNRIP